MDEVALFAVGRDDLLSAFDHSFFSSLGETNETSLSINAEAIIASGVIGKWSDSTSA